jgi:xanthine dehydrogenase YagS FAD-binding subunit
MNKFSYFEASSIQEALEQTNSTVSSTIQPNALPDASVLKSGGIDLLDLMKEGLSQPKKLVSIRNIEGLNELSFDEKKGMRIGANVTLAKIVADAQIKENYFALHQAASSAATPQIRNMATLGGNLAQRTRCWYFRSKYHVCYRKGSSTCFAQIGENEYHAILGNQDCASVHASSLATALVAFDAAVEITAKDGKVKIVKIDDFFVSPDVDPSRENILEANEIITAVILPKANENIKSYYIKMGQRESNDWPLADVAVVAELSGEKCKKAKVVLGAAAPVPYVSEEAAAAIKGQVVTNETATTAGKAAMAAATPLSQNAYKIPVFETIIERAIGAALC